MPISLRISDNIDQLMCSPEPVVALNLMGLSLIESDGFDPEEAVYWADGVLGKIACNGAGVDVERKPGRQLLTEVLAYLRDVTPQRPVIVLGANHPVAILPQMLGRNLAEGGVPWVKTYEEIAGLTLPEIGPDVGKNHIIILSVGSPKQEWIAQEIFRRCGAKCFCVGGAVNMLEGHEKIVPPFFEQIGCEWLYRLLSEPNRRLARLFDTFPAGLKCLVHCRVGKRLVIKRLD